MPLITSGSARGRKIKLPPGEVRPATSRVKQATFDYLGETVINARALDLYCGSGGLGLEALSRGAEECWFVDLSEKVIAVAQENAATLGFTDRCRFVCQDVFKFLRPATDSTIEAPPRFDLIFVAPPYRIAAPERLLTALAASGLVAEGGCVCLEYARHTAPPHPAQFNLDRRREYGETVIEVWSYAGN